MPIYEYECNACGHRHEIIQKLSDAPARDCPECGRPDLRKLVSAPGFRLGGGGWYETDFKNGNRRNIKESESAPKADAPKADAPKAQGGCASGGCGCAVPGDRA